MKERPILFSAPMVRAVLNGSKTQTRRVVKFGDNGFGQKWSFDGMPSDYVSRFWHDYLTCPYGQTGDRLWVRESWCPGVPAVHSTSGNKYGILPYPKSWVIPKDKPEGIQLRYAASWEGEDVPPMRPSIHMPRWASRITLKVTDVRMQRLNEINEADAQAEGPELFSLDHGNKHSTPVETHKSAFKFLWDSINAKRGYGWDVNPWVWAISF